MYKDEDAPITSSAEYLQSPHEAERKALMRKLEKQGLKEEANKHGADIQSLKRALLKAQVEDAKNDPSTDDTAHHSQSDIGTKTREEEIKAWADDKPTAGKLVQQGKQDEKAMETLKQDEVQSEDA